MQSSVFPASLHEGGVAPSAKAGWYETNSAPKTTEKITARSRIIGRFKCCTKNFSFLSFYCIYTVPLNQCQSIKHTFYLYVSLKTIVNKNRICQCSLQVSLKATPKCRFFRPSLLKMLTFCDSLISTGLTQRH